MQLSPATEAHLSRVESFVVKDKVDAGCPWLWICMERFKCLCNSLGQNICKRESGGRESRQEQMPMPGSAIKKKKNKKKKTTQSNVGWENNPMLEKV